MPKIPISVAGTLVALAAVASAQDSAASSAAAGRLAYAACIGCHMVDGLGRVPLFPPLAKSPYVTGSAERLIAVILKGNHGPLMLGGNRFNNPMAGLEKLPDDQIASVATYVRHSFGNTASAVTPALVATTREKFLERKAPWSQSELDAWKDSPSPK